jgi:hypothetical protein
VHLQRSEGSDRRDDFVGDSGGAELPASVSRGAELQAIRRVAFHQARST